MVSRIQREVTPTHPRPSRMQKRSSLEIMATILDKAILGALKTRIMYHSNLSHQQLQAYLEMLIDLDLLTPPAPRRGRHQFHTTPKGQQFLRAYRALQALMR